MASYARLSTDESGRLQPESASSRKHMPMFAFVAGLLLTVAYYESPGLGLGMPAASPTSSSSSLASSNEANSDYGSFVVAGEQSPEAAAQELSAARAALTSAQRLADDRAAEAQRLLAELDALKSSSSSSSSSSSQAGCQAELAAAVAQTSRARAQAQAAAEAQASAERAAAAATREAVTSSASSGAYHSSESSSSGSVVSAQAFDIDSYRTERLAATQPNIIECAEAGEGKSQETCHLPKAERFASIGQKGVTVWMTGLSGSGKSTIAKALERHLVVELGLSVQNLDGDNVRTGLNRDLGFSPGDRAESVRRVGEMACLFSGGGVITLVTLVSPYRADRDAARARHEAQGIPFLEVVMDVPLEVVQQRDPKGLYAKALRGELKGMTGMSEDAPYEPPLVPELVLPNYKLSIEESVKQLTLLLKKSGALTGGPTHHLGLPLPLSATSEASAYLEDELIVTDATKLAALHAEAATLPKALIGDIEINWLQVIGEGWAAPLKGFLREGPLMQVLHFNSLMVDPYNRTGADGLNEQPTNWNDYTTRGVERQPLSVPIVLPATSYTKTAIEASGKKAVALVDKDGRTLAILRNPEIYAHRKEEIATRCFGAVDMGHPYIEHMYSGGNWLIGGEVTLLGRVRYHDGLDRWRLTPKELYAEFEAKGADVVYAFQTRNPTHAGHAYLMKTGLEKLKEKGFKKPLLWLSPLGGWTKSDDVPLDVRVKQHQAIIDEGMLDADTTVMAIWPAPMIYGGPTEVQFHASSRRNAGASFFVVGRDAAGMKGSSVAVAHPDDDLYKGEHARYVLQMSPVLEDREMGLISFDKFYYDTKDHQMKAMDESRPDDFISISGSKMRALAAQGATPCPDPIPNDLLAANCVPQGFMAPAGWQIVCDYYQRMAADNSGSGSSSLVENRFVPWSKAVVTLASPTRSAIAPSAAVEASRGPEVSAHAVAHGAYGTLAFRLFLQDPNTAPASSSSYGVASANSNQAAAAASPWHDVPLVASEASSSQGSSSSPLLNLVTEIPMYTTAKMEVSKGAAGNPIAQDANKDGSPRYYGYGTPFFNYGMLPRTWEDPAFCEGFHGACGDGDPVDVMEVGANPLPMGSVTPVKVLGAFELIDEGETDYKIITLAADDADAWRIHDMSSLELHKPGITAQLVDWLKRYKTAENKPENSLASESPCGVTEALQIVKDTNVKWSQLVRGEVANPKNHFIGLANAADSLPVPAGVLEMKAAQSNQGSSMPPLASLSSFSSLAGQTTSGASSTAVATSEGRSNEKGGFSSCMALCRSMNGGDMQQQCVASCVEKYGRRRALRAVE